MLGDFNDVLYSSDKEGGREKSYSELERFRNFMANCNMLEMETKGCKFTLMNNRDGEGFIRE